MKTRDLFVLLLLLAPAILGGLAAIGLQSGPDWNPVYAVRSRIDLGSLLFFGGLLVSFGSLLGWFIRLKYDNQRESQLQQTRTDLLLSRRRFLRQLDHELKNPLTALNMEVAYLAGESPADDYEQVLADMSTQLDRISRLVTDLRRLAQLEEQQIQRVPVVLEEVLQEVMEAAQEHPNFKDRQVRLNLLSHPLPLSPISGDRGLLWLACFNLLDNALKFTPAGVEVEVRAFEISPWLVVEVADSGPGISGTDLPHIFEELYRGANAQGVPGSGLGLALVQTIVALHGGSIDVRSKPGQGTVFSMRLRVLT